MPGPTNHLERAMKAVKKPGKAKQRISATLYLGEALPLKRKREKVEKEWRDLSLHIGIKEGRNFMWHMDKDVEGALIKLNDSICEWERITSREYTVALIPHQADESIQVFQNGKPMDPEMVKNIGIHSLVEQAEKQRE